MMRQAAALGLTAFLALSSVGCGSAPSGPGAPPQETSKAASAEELKTRLQGVVDSGVAGSALAGMAELIEKVEDAGKRDALKKDYDRIQQSSNPAEIKKLAQDMLSKL